MYEGRDFAYARLYPTELRALGLVNRGALEPFGEALQRALPQLRERGIPARQAVSYDGRIPDPFPQYLAGLVAQGDAALPGKLLKPTLRRSIKPDVEVVVVRHCCDTFWSAPPAPPRPAAVRNAERRVT